MGRQPKAQTQHKHACRRAMERFGLYENDVLAVEQMIRHGESIAVERQSNRVVIHEVVYNDITMHVAYDGLRRQAITFLHPEGNPLDLIGG